MRNEIINELSIEEFISSFINSLCPDCVIKNICSYEILSEIIKRVAVSICPCSKIKLYNMVVKLTEDLIESKVEFEPLVNEIIEYLIDLGDLLELQSDHYDKRKQLYLSPYKYVAINNQQIILLGFNNSFLKYFPPENLPVISINKCLRFTDRKYIKNLSILGFYEITLNEWLKFDIYDSPEKYLRLFEDKIGLLQNSPEKIDQLTIIEKDSHVNYYNGRWSEVKQKHSGFYIGKRGLQYNSYLWCFLEIRNNTILKLLDLPFIDLNQRGCDEAWRIQMAMDHINKSPQTYRVRKLSDNEVAIDFFSPVPSWATKKLEVEGQRLAKYKCLFTYKFDKIKLSEIEEFLTKNLWLINSNINKLI